MKILWITPIQVCICSELFFNKKANGVWLDAELNSFLLNKAKDGIELAVATCENVSSIRRAERDGVTYYLLPGGASYDYKTGKKSNQQAIRQLIAEVNPDIVHLWGTESAFAYEVVNCLPADQKCVIYIQGVVRSIPRYMKAGIKDIEILKNYTLFDVVRGTGIYSQIRRYDKVAKREEKMIEKAGSIIGENQWSRAYYSAINPSADFYPCPLNINTFFYKNKWDSEKIEQHSILCNSSNYSLKGLHMLLKALVLVKKRYPDVKLYVPGNNNAKKSGLINVIKRSGYVKYIRRLLTKNDLWGSVEFLGFLSAEEMSLRLSKAHVFAMSSAIENHSSSLKEAMLVGVPSVSSIVGGVSEYARHNENALLYRFEDYEVLASHICDLFGDAELCQKLSERAREDMKSLHIDFDIHSTMVNAYTEILNK